MLGLMRCVTALFVRALYEHPYHKPRHVSSAMMGDSKAITLR